MTTSDRIDALHIGDRVTLTLNNSITERITGTVTHVDGRVVRLMRVDGRPVSIARCAGFISRIRKES